MNFILFIALAEGSNNVAQIAAAVVVAFGYGIYKFLTKKE